MLFEEANTDLRALGERLFALIRQQGGGVPKLMGEWYQSKIQGMPVLYFRFIGNRASIYPKNSIYTATRWHNVF